MKKLLKFAIIAFVVLAVIGIVLNEIDDLDETAVAEESHSICSPNCMAGVIDNPYLFPGLDGGCIIWHVRVGDNERIAFTLDDLDRYDAPHLSAIAYIYYPHPVRH